MAWVFNPFTGKLDYTNVSFTPTDPVSLDDNANTLLSVTNQVLGLDVQAANKIFAGPESGPDAVPTFRNLVISDLPDLSGTYAVLNHNHNLADLAEKNFTSLSNIPTTLAGYGIIDAQPLDDALTSISGLTFVSPSFIKLVTEDTYEARTLAEVRADLSLNNVENIALSTWIGSTNITTLGTIVTGIWKGTAIEDAYISSAAAWNNKLDDITGEKFDDLSDIPAHPGVVNKILNTTLTAYEWIDKPSAGDFAHNSLSGLNDGDDYEHITQTQKNNLHTQNTDTALGAQTANLDMNTHKITNVVDPTANQDAATKKYVDDKDAVLAGKNIFSSFIDLIHWNSIDGFTAVKDGTGYVSVGDAEVTLGTDSVAGYDTDLMSSGFYRGLIVSGKTLTIEFTLNYLAQTTQNKVWLYFCYTYANPPDDVDHSIGFKIINGTVYVNNGDGSNNTQTSTGVTLSSGNQNTRLKFVYTPGTNCKFYVNDVLKVTHTTNLTTQTQMRIYLGIQTTEASMKSAAFGRILIEKQY